MADRLTYPLPAALHRGEVDRALAELGLAGAMDRVKSVTISWGGVQVQIHAEGPDGRSVRSLDSSAPAIDTVTIPVVG